MVMSGVYQIYNTITSDLYVGSSKNIENRVKNHKWQLNKNSHPNQHLQNAWNFYGEDAFNISILEECNPEKVILLEREQHYLDLLKPQYNFCKTAGSCLGIKRKPFTSEHRQKMSEAAKKRNGRALTPETKEKISLAKTGKERSPDTKNKISNAHKGKTLSEEHKQKIRDSVIRHLSTKEKIYVRKS